MNVSYFLWNNCNFFFTGIQAATNHTYNISSLKTVLTSVKLQLQFTVSLDYPSVNTCCCPCTCIALTCAQAIFSFARFNVVLSGAFRLPVGLRSWCCNLRQFVCTIVIQIQILAQIYIFIYVLSGFQFCQIVCRILIWPLLVLQTIQFEYFKLFSCSNFAHTY